MEQDPFRLPANRRTMIVALLIFLGIPVALPGEEAPLIPTGHWGGVIEHEGRAWRVELDLATDGRSARGTVTYPEGGWFMLPLTGVRLTGSEVELIHDLDRGAVRWRGTMDRHRFQGTWHGWGVEATFQLSRIDSHPRLVVEVPVRFRGGGTTRLAGTLILPNGTPPYPAAVWVHGTGSIGRDHRSYRTWGYLLARHGVACLLYDKRGVGDSTGSFRTASLTDLASDAIAGARVLANHPDIDLDRIGIGGFSQGGTIAPLALSRTDRFAFIIAVSASGVSPAEQSDFAIAHRLRDRGFDEGAVAIATSLRRRVHEFSRFGTGRDALAGDLRTHLDAPWFHVALLPASSLEVHRAQTPDWAFLDPIPLWAGMTIPTLAVWGSEDRLVPSGRSFELIAAALRQAGNASATLRVLPGADHDLMLPCARNEAWDGPRIAPELEPLLEAWIREHVARSEPKIVPRDGISDLHP